MAAGRRALWARGEPAGQAAAWAVRSWAEPEAVGRVRKGNRGTGLDPREEERGWRAGPAGLSRRGEGGPLASGLGEGREERLGRTGCLGHAVGVLGGPLSEGEEMGWAEVWQLGPG